MWLFMSPCRVRCECKCVKPSATSTAKPSLSRNGKLRQRSLRGKSLPLLMLLAASLALPVPCMQSKREPTSRSSRRSMGLGVSTAATSPATFGCDNLAKVLASAKNKRNKPNGGSFRRLANMNSFTATGTTTSSSSGRCCCSLPPLPLLLLFLF